MAISSRALPGSSVRGRGAGLNPANRFETIHLKLLDEHREAVATEHPDGVQVHRQVIDDATRSVINRVDSPDLSMQWTLNPYRGCEHGCIYCYARPGHEYLGLSCGIDFETRIHAKREAPELLRRALMAPSWKGETLALSGVTDPYQPVERELQITRRCLEVCVEFRQPVVIVTKSRLVLRDLDLLAALHEHGAAGVAVSVTSLDNRLASVMEPRASSPRDRLETIRALAAAGIPVTVMAAPMIPRINDHELPAILRAAAEAGATQAGYTFIRLPHQIKDLFLDWLRRHFPDRAAHVESLVRQSRGGTLYSAEWFTRHRGEGAIAEQIGQTFKVFARRYGLDRARVGQARPTPFRRPGSQAMLFE